MNRAPGFYLVLTGVFAIKTHGKATNGTPESAGVRLAKTTIADWMNRLVSFPVVS